MGICTKHLFENEGWNSANNYEKKKINVGDMRVCYVCDMLCAWK